MSALFNLVFAADPIQNNLQLVLRSMSLEQMVLMEWKTKVTYSQVQTWQHRNSRKKYAYKLPLPVAVALWRMLRLARMEPALQMFSDSLDKALVNSGFSTKNFTYQVA
jgi:hypothetical protein